MSNSSTATSNLATFPGIQNYIGPGLVTVLLNALETGIIINQAITFWEHASTSSAHGTHVNDRCYEGDKIGRSYQSSSGATRRSGEQRVVKGIALFVLIISIAQTTMSFYDAWTTLVGSFGDWVGAIEVHWPSKIQPVVNVMLAAPVQSFLTWRCWLLIDRNIYVFMSLAMLLLTSVAMAIVVTINVFHISFTSAFNPTTFAAGTPPPPVPLDPYFLSSLAIPCVLDVILTSILVTFLIRSKRVVVSRRFRKTLHSLIVIVWEAALPPCICAIVTFITYITLVQTSFWDLLFQGILGQLYVISLFVTLNGFHDVKNRDNSVSPTTALGISWSDVPHARLSHIERRHTIDFTQSIDIHPGRSFFNESQAHSPQSPRSVYLSQLSRYQTQSHNAIDIPTPVPTVPDLGLDSDDSKVEQDEIYEDSRILKYELQQEFAEV